ncbi:hypothetical protein H9Q08_17080 [Chryseobacterium sp. PS-8]|uniref:Uncharacterized protein n=1 Tax=Chryseobacterium indicum TaxID=2766954 RepID=A0ABS9C8V5_9FLAO|nr:hypothetical protein [Chryseobacterium sp. PS-8]MCF2221001.1 hypothetical protein [Chryseobacterium sp. PS-8]
MKKIISIFVFFVLIQNAFAYKYVLIGKRADGNGCQFAVYDDNGSFLHTCQDNCLSTPVNPKPGQNQIIEINPKSELGKWILKNDPKQDLKKVKFFNPSDLKTNNKRNNVLNK